MPEPLSGPQERTLKAIKAHIDKYGWAPSIREICKASNVRSTSTAWAHLSALESKELVRLGAKGQPRAIALTEKGRTWTRPRTSIKQ